MKNKPTSLFNKLQNLFTLFLGEQKILLGLDINNISMKKITAMYRSESINYVTYRKYYELKNIFNTLSYTIRDLRIMGKKTNDRELLYNENQFIKEVELFLSKIDKNNLFETICNNILVISESTPMK